MVLATEAALEHLRAASPVVPVLGDAWIVGGAVRDALLGRPAGKDLDAVDPQDGVARAQALRRQLGGELTVHDRFGTATVTGDGWSVDLATARAEVYERPGALPTVTVPAPLEQDLLRRDFTVNAIALRPDGELRAAPGALDDLAAGRLRILHDASFVDDPTRLYRLARYAARLGFAVEERTERLARAAFASDAPATAGAARVGNEMLLLLGEEPDVALRALGILRSLGGIEPFHLGLLRRAVALLPAREVLIAALYGGVPEGWHVAHPGPVLDAARDPAGLAAEMRAVSRPSELYRLLRHRSPEAVALAGAHGAEWEAREWLDELRHVRLEIGGNDLIERGIAPFHLGLLRRALELLPSPSVLLAALYGGVPAGWHVAQPGPVLDAARDPEGLAAEMRAAERPSELFRLLRRRSAEAVALAGARGAEEQARLWRDSLRHARLSIGGDDLVAAGVPVGPEIGLRLDAALARKLDEGLVGRDAELAAALGADLDAG